MLIETLATAAALAFGATSLLWLLSLPLKNASIIDIFWAPGFALIAWGIWLLLPGSPPQAALLAVLASLWALRLAGYLAWRNIGHGEDKRYAKMRDKHGDAFWWVSLFKVFWLQAALMCVVSLPLQLGQLGALPAELTWLDWLGTAVFLFGFAFEATGDIQLARFKADPSNDGEVMNRGLWAWTRHPNYFGNAVLWWGLYLIAASHSPGWWSLIGPLLMTFLLLKVSGVSLLESDLKQRKPGYAEYVKNTPAFVPRPPRSG